MPSAKFSLIRVHFLTKGALHFITGQVYLYSIREGLIKELQHKKIVGMHAYRA